MQPNAWLILKQHVLFCYNWNNPPRSTTTMQNSDQNVTPHLSTNKEDDEAIKLMSEHNLEELININNSSIVTRIIVSSIHSGETKSIFDDDSVI